MYEDDVQLDEYGNSVIKNGDFGLTTDDKEFILRMLTTTPASWLLHPGLGVGLERYIGRQNNDRTYSEMKADIISFFKTYCILAKVNITLLSDLAAGINIEFANLFSTKYTEVTLAFNMENGSVLFLHENATLKDSALIESVKPYVNRYLQRRY